jgi:hypothetical protein
MTNDRQGTGWVRFVDCRFTNVERKKAWDDRQTWRWPTGEGKTGL